MTPYKSRTPTPEECIHCPLCADGWPIIENGLHQLHELPEPAGMFKHFTKQDAKNQDGDE